MVAAFFVACSTKRATPDQPPPRAPWRELSSFVCPRRPPRALASDATVACNGSPALCDRRYDQVTFPMTHNSMSNADEGWPSANQQHGIVRQLVDGVRGLMLDVHSWDRLTGVSDERRSDMSALEQTFLCHDTCRASRKPLVEGLCEITQFLDEHPAEVVSIIFESYVPSADVAAAMVSSGLVQRVVHHQLGEQWPTLGQMVEHDSRVVIFTEEGDNQPAWNLSAWDSIWDTPYTFQRPSDLSCRLGRGAQTNSLFLMNHWLEQPAHRREWAQRMNAEPALLPRMLECSTDAGRRPNFVAVDHYDLGDLFEVVRRANGL
jgi:hypothetical protein